MFGPTADPGRRRCLVFAIAMALAVGKAVEVVAAATAGGSHSRRLQQQAAAAAVAAADAAAAAAAPLVPTASGHGAVTC